MGNNKKVVFAVLGVGILIIVMLGALLVQGHNNSPEVQAEKSSSSSVASSLSAKSSISSSKSAESISIAKSAKKFDSIQGPVILSTDGIGYKTIWSEQEFNDYVSANELEITGHVDGSIHNDAEVPVSNLGTSKSFSTWDELSRVINSDYYPSATEAYKASVVEKKGDPDIKIMDQVK